jgi:hypothetical protein
MRNIHKIFVLGLILLLFMSINALAKEGDSHEENRFSASVEVGAIWFNTTDQLFTDRFFAGDKNEKTDNLNGPADDFNITMPMVLFDLRYKFRDTDKEVYLKNPFESSDSELTLGMAQTFANKSKLDVSIFYGMGTVWKDPYIVQENRDKSDTNNFGLTIDYDINANLNLSYRYNQVDVDQDIIGQRLNDLERDGVIHGTGIGYKVNLDRSNIIIPRFEYTKADMDGESNSYNGYKLEIGYMRMEKDYILSAFVSVDKKDYEEKHPIFNKNREEKEYSAIAILTLLNPLGYDRFFTNFIAGYGYRDSNIDFYDKRTHIGGITIGYNF